MIHMSPWPLAYIDPGTGSFLLQMLIAGSLGVLFAVRRTLKNIFMRIKGKLSKQGQSEKK